MEIKKNLKKKIMLNTELKRLIISTKSFEDVYKVIVSKETPVDDSELTYFFHQASKNEIKEELRNLGYYVFDKPEVVESIVSQPIPIKPIKTERLITNKNHPESYYAKTRNIPEMKLKMIEDKIYYDNKSKDANERKLAVLFECSDEEIEQYFSKKMKRRSNVKKDDKGALIQFNDRPNFPTLHYRMIDLADYAWVDAQEWLRFFMALGQYLENFEGSISMYVSYITSAIPASLVSLGIMEQYFENIKSKETNESEKGIYNPGDEVSYYDGKNWRSSLIIGVRNESTMAGKFNPYMDIEVRMPGEMPYKASVPHNQWIGKVRHGGIIKNTRGNGNVVRFNDRISRILGQRYGKGINELRINPELHINMIGRGLDRKLREIRQAIQFSDSQGAFMMTDFLYFDNDDESNYVNIHMVKSEHDIVNANKKAISVFVGQKSGLDFASHRTRKNIYITSRVREQYLEDGNLLISQLSQQSFRNFEERNNEIQRIIEYLNQMNIRIPKGVEIYGF